MKSILLKKKYTLLFILTILILQISSGNLLKLNDSYLNIFAYVKFAIATIATFIFLPRLFNEWKLKKIVDNKIES